ncbi:hypothetical protein K443DRAFT_115332, partial [Laccaria amethystina LaAM-08-1]
MHETSSFELFLCFYNSSGPIDTQVHNGTDTSSPTPLLPQCTSIPCAYPPLNARNDFIRTLCNGTNTFSLTPLLPQFPSI